MTTLKKLPKANPRMKKNKLNILYIFPKKKSAFHLFQKE
jgi:hypothetical protein